MQMPCRCEQIVAPRKAAQKIVAPLSAAAATVSVTMATFRIGLFSSSEDVRGGNFHPGAAGRSGVCTSKLGEQTSLTFLLPSDL